MAAENGVVKRSNAQLRQGTGGSVIGLRDVPSVAAGLTGGQRDPHPVSVGDGLPIS